MIVSDKAKKMGIEIPVELDGSLLNTLRPNPYLESLGINLDGRIDNILEIVRANIDFQNPCAPKSVQVEPHLSDNPCSVQTRQLPLVLLKGPIVQEQLMYISVAVEVSSDGLATLKIKQARETDA